MKLRDRISDWMLIYIKHHNMFKLCSNMLADITNLGVFARLHQAANLHKKRTAEWNRGGWDRIDFKQYTYP